MSYKTSLATHGLRREPSAKYAYCECGDWLIGYRRPELVTKSFHRHVTAAEIAAGHALHHGATPELQQAMEEISSRFCKHVLNDPRWYRPSEGKWLGAGTRDSAN